jgi:hypothetical protein
LIQASFQLITWAGLSIAVSIRKCSTGFDILIAHRRGGKGEEKGEGEDPKRGKAREGKGETGPEK